MCLIAFALDADPGYRLILVGNRDEFHDRPAQTLQWWRDAPDIAGGRDLQAGGTWLGVHRRGRIAAITNVREPSAPTPTGDEPSRGELPRAFLEGDAMPIDHARALARAPRPPMAAYRGFNLLMFAAARGSSVEGAWLSNRHAAPVALRPGIYGLSNHLLDTPWPKVTALKQALAGGLASRNRQDLTERLFSALADTRPARDDHLPDSGLPLARERTLSAAFVDDPGYGTRASTVLLVDAQGVLTVEERSWPRHGPAAGPVAQRSLSFPIA
jgi:uncharacterized protein with NRDE domain